MKIETIAQLEAIYGTFETVSEAARTKVMDRIIPAYRAFIEASPFVALATNGLDGLDCSPRGDAPGFVRIHDDRTLMLPDRRGNNRVDSLRNIVRDPRVALLFLTPGSGTTFRVNGRAHLTTDPDLLASFITDGKTPRSVMVVEIDEIYFQCSRAILRSELWNPTRFIADGILPTAGQMVAAVTQGRTDAAEYDSAWPARAVANLW
jgi:PPOX class probable FMN-dependent enzyme